MTSPPTLHINNIVLGERLRSSHDGIEDLAQSILDNGLIQPIVLVPLGSGYLVTDVPGRAGPLMKPTELFGLDAGGRRFHALKHLLEIEEWDGNLTHAATSNPGFPGYVLKGEDEATPLKRLLTEIAENTQRSDPDWRDQLKAIVKAYKLARSEAHQRGEKCLLQDFGYLLGVSYQKLQAAVKIHDEVISNPARFKDCPSIRAAYSMMLKDSANFLARMQAEKSLSTAPVPVLVGPEREIGVLVDVPVDELPPTVIRLSDSFRNVDSFEFMKSLPDNSFDHIYTDPDYGVSVDRLSANSSSAVDGVVQASVSDSLSDLTALLLEAWRLIKPQGFFVLWYDLDHHEKLQTRATEIGFRVQRWPLIWHKTDYRSNAAPAHNFCKNMEYAMVCRKPNAILVKAQMSSVYSCTSGSVQKEFHHPFAKPLELHTWILSAIAIKGQSVYDPFGGCMTIGAAAARYGLRPVSTEINVDHYSNGIMNLQRVYKKLLTGEVVFQ